MTEMLALDFMQRALLAAVLVGATAPLVGVFLLQRRLALIGDGMGHVALAGVAIGLFFSQSPVWTALICAVIAAIGTELIRTHGRTQGDVALALIFYGGIAASVVIIAKSPRGTSASLTAYLFGAITTVAPGDLWAFAALSMVIIATVAVLRSRLFAVASDEEYARAAGLPVLGLNLALAILTAITVVVSMRIVGLLLISALMIVPSAAAQLLGRSFASAMTWAVSIGLFCAVGGVVVSYAADTPSGATIVLLAIAVFMLVAIGSAVVAGMGRRRPVDHRPAERHGHEHGPGCGHEAVVHDDHVDYLHDGHRHAPHGAHYDEHPDEQPDEQSDEQSDEHPAKRADSLANGRSHAHPDNAPRSHR